MFSCDTGSPSAKLEFPKDAAVKAELVSGSKHEEQQTLPSTPSRSAAMHGK